MTREESIRTKTWVTDDGRYLAVDAIDPDHLSALRGMLHRELTPGYDDSVGRLIASSFATGQESLLDYTTEGTSAELDLDAYRSAWLQIIDDEVVRRTRPA